MEDTKSPHYVLVIDEKRNTILSVLYNLMMTVPGGRHAFEHTCFQSDVTKAEIEDFFKEWADKEHPLGWCKDPDCKTNGEPRP